jgi:Tfp pilus assembly protein PilN
VRVSLNLLERLQLDDRARLVARSTAVASGLLAVMAIGVGLSGMLEVRQRRVQILTSLERRERLYQSLRPEIRAMLQRQQHTQRRMRQLERLGLEADALTDLLAQVAAVLPDSVWLTKLESVKPVPVAGAREAAAGSVAEALLEGRAKAFQDVTQLLDRLKAIPGVASVKPLSTSVVPDGGGGGKEEVVFAVQVQRAGRR